MVKIIEPEEVFSNDEIKRLIRWITYYKNPLLFFLRNHAEHVFSEFDDLYFQRTGISEGDYLSSMIAEVRQEASLRYTELPNGLNDTMFHYSEEQRYQGYRAVEARLIERCAEEERRLRFKAYVARRYGLRVPLK